MARKLWSTVIIEKTMYAKMKELCDQKKLATMQDFYRWVIDLCEKELNTIESK